MRALGSNNDDFFSAILILFGIVFMTITVVSGLWRISSTLEEAPPEHSQECIEKLEEFAGDLNFSIEKCEEDLKLVDEHRPEC